MADLPPLEEHLIDVAVTPPLEAGAHTIPGCNWNLFRSLPNFNLRNGDVSAVTSVFIRASIATTFHWVPIANLAPDDGVKAIDGFIKSHMAYLAIHQPPGSSAELRRKIAICLGVARAVSTTFYRLGMNDLIAGERAPAFLSASKDENGNIAFTTRADLIPDAAAILNTELELSDEERSVICALIKCATGIVPMQGYSLMMTNHHYLPQAETQSRKVYAVAERAYWMSQDVAGWFATDTAAIQDALWHKACHPIMINVKTSMAMDSTIAAKLTQAGSGACASRLPAVETELRSANSYMTLMATVNPMFGICGGSVNFDAVVAITDIVKAYPPGVANPATGPTIPEELRGIITNRSTALTYLGNLLKRSQDMVAYCYGFYIALTDATMMTGMAGGAQADTLKSSFSLTKLKNQSFASYTTGHQAYGDFQAVRNAKRQRGEFQAPEFVLN